MEHSGRPARFLIEEAMGEIHPRQPAPIAPTNLHDESIDDLLLNIEEQRVVPLLGPELLLIKHDGQETTLYQFLAERLAEKLRVPIEELPQHYTLNDVAACRSRNHDVGEVYSRLRRRPIGGLPRAEPGQSRRVPVKRLR